METSTLVPGVQECNEEAARAQLTDNHDVEVEALSDALAVPLVREVGKANVACQLPANHISAIVGGRGC